MSFKPWLRAGATAVLSLALSATSAVAQGQGRGHDKHDRNDDDDRGDGRGHGHDHDRCSDHDRDQIRGWYRTHYSSLPPGLAKRDRLPPGLERQLVIRGTLPHGLQKKMQPCPGGAGKNAAASASELRARRDRRQFGSAESGELPDRRCFPLRDQLGRKSAVVASKEGDGS